jgi:DNA-binding LacI/PurR family transcriptional regulator
MLEKKVNRRKKQTTLKILAEHLDLAPGTVSKVLNNANGSEAISQVTKTRIRVAARKLQYRPNFLAQSLRTKRTYMIGVLALELANSANALVIAGIERFLRRRGYIFALGVHRNDPEVLAEYESLFQRRGVEGLITVDAQFPYRSALPTVAVTIPRYWIAENHPTAGSSSLREGSMLTSRFLERVGETATETLLAQIEPHAEYAVGLSGELESIVRHWGGGTMGGTAL